jgi:hypothetical protein
MTPEIALNHDFVEFIPDELEQGTVYVSIRFATASHLCVCGCGNKVVTPIRPTDWTLTFDGKTISLDPSIGTGVFHASLITTSGKTASNGLRNGRASKSSEGGSMIIMRNSATSKSAISKVALISPHLKPRNRNTLGGKRLRICGRNFCYFMNTMNTAATVMWYDNLPGEKSWSRLWYDYTICGRCRGIRAFEGSCSVCGDPPFDIKPKITRDQKGKEIVMPQTFMGAEGRYEDWIYLRMMEREWKRPIPPD